MSNSIEEIQGGGAGGNKGIEAYKQMIEKYQAGSANGSGETEKAQEVGGADAAAQASSIQGAQSVPQDGAQISEEAVKGIDETESAGNTKQLLEQLKNYSSGESGETDSAVGAGGAEQASQVGSSQQVGEVSSAQGSEEASKIGGGSQDVSQVQGNSDLKQTEQVSGAGNMEEILKNSAQANFQQ